METLGFRRRQRRLTIVDRLATDHPGSLTGCSFSDLGDAFCQMNNNDPEMLSYYLSDYVEQFWPWMHEANNNNYNDGAKTNLRLSDLLHNGERESLREYVGENDVLLASGVCQLLKEEDGKWSVFGVGVVCLIKNNADRIFSISLVEPSNDGTPARVVWFTALSRQFLTTKNHSNLLSFEIKVGNSQQVFGLNFSDHEEAAFFHKIIFEAYHSYQNRKSIRKGPKRMAPPPPSMPLPDQSCLAKDITSHGVEIPIVRVKKEKKKGLLGRTRDKIFGEKKSKKDKPDISAPTNFQHVQHGLQDLTEEQKSIVKVLMEKGLKIEPDNQEQLEILKKNVVEKYEVLKMEVEEVPEPPAKEEQENLHPQFQRSTSNGLTVARSSIHLQKGGRGNKPRDIKKQSSKRKEEHFDPLKPNWEDEMPVAPTTAMVEARPPPPPSRTASRVPLQRQDTPPHPRIGPPSEAPPPRLPHRGESVRRDVPDHSYPPANIPPPPAVSLAAPPAPPPPPPSLMVPGVKPSSSSPSPPPPISKVTIQVEPSSSSVHPPSLSSLPAVSPDRRSFLDEIQTVDKTKLLRPVDRSPSRSDVTPVGQEMGIISSIQRELDLRRKTMADSEEDSSTDSEDDESWSD